MKHTKTHKHFLSIRHLYFALGVCGIFIAALANSPAPTQAALKPPAPDYHGAIDKADCSSVRGLAYDDNAPDQTISVDIYDNSTYLMTLPANVHRKDLARAGWENPFHGFQFTTPNSMKDTNIHSLHVKFAGTNIEVSGSPKSIACDSSLFPTAVPETTAGGEGKTWEQGVEFSSSLDGIITEVRFWRAAGEPKGGHTARIWSTSGALLKSATFVESTSPGWQYAAVNFPISAGVRYRVTYNINQQVAKTFHVLNNGPITKGPLTAWSSWYGTPAGTFPTSHSTSNLFADVVFSSR